MLLDVATLADTSALLRETFRDSSRGDARGDSNDRPGTTARKWPLLTAKAAAVADLRPLAVAIRRAILPNGEVGSAADALQSVELADKSCRLLLQLSPSDDSARNSPASETAIPAAITINRLSGSRARAREYSAKK